MDDLKNKFDEWKTKTLRPVLDRSPERLSEFKTESGFSIKRLYTPADYSEADYGSNLGFPGQYPYTRGVYPTMYRGRLWTMRNYAGFGSAEDTNKRYRYLLDQGMVGLSMAFDLPTQLGYDSDDLLCEGSVGRVGVAVDSLEDMEIIFKGIPLDKVSTSMTINATAPILLALYIAVAEKQNVSPERLMGTTQNDILKEFIARGTYIFPPEPSLRLALDIVEYCSKQIPRWNTLNIAGYHFREAGASAIQELAFTIADAITYIEKAIERGLDIDSFAPRLSYSLGCYMDLFEEVAKFRAARRLFARTMEKRFGAKNPKSYQFRIFTGSCGSTLVTQQPLNNIVRVAMHTLMGILGGAQAIHTACWDEGYGIPSENSARIALRTQQILAHECGISDTIDPLGGSYYVESLTNEIEKEASQYLDTIDEMGGMIAAIDSGFVHREIQESSVAFQKKIESGERVIVGLNRYQVDEESEIDQQDIFEVDSQIEGHQKEKLKQLRTRRNNGKVSEALTALSGAIDNENENLMPFIIEAVRSYATVGEICRVMRDQWGEYKPPVCI